MLPLKLSRLHKTILRWLYLAGPAWTGSPCSRRPLWCQRCSPSTGWSSSWRWSSQRCPPQRTSSTLWEEWNRPGSSRTDSTRSNRAPCTSPLSWAAWQKWRKRLDHQGKKVLTRTLKCLEAVSVGKWTEVSHLPPVSCLIF